MKGTEADIKQGDKVLPKLKIKSGVFFLNRDFGISFVASELLVVKGVDASTSSGFDLGGVEVADSEMVDAVEAESDED